MSTGKVAKKHDCGRHGLMTVAQIACHAGLATQTIYGRLRDGIRGEALVAPPVRPQRYPGHYTEDLHLDPNSSSRMAVACYIARLCGKNPPSVQMLRDRLGMSRANAYRWRRAWLDANWRAQ